MESLKSSELTANMLIHAYSVGWFPMVTDEETHHVDWFEPIRRCLFPIEGIHVSKSLRKTINQQVFEVRFNTAYEEVMRGCLRPPGENWIDEGIIRAYTEAHYHGFGHCAECWRNGQLVGGVYGIALGGAFFAESMFHRETNASKVALWALVEACREQGFVLFDAQIMNPHLKSLGAFEISKREYNRRLEQALAVNPKLDTFCQKA